MLQKEDAFASQLATDICNYLDDLKTQRQLLITVHLLDERNLPCWYRFLAYTIHQSIYCLCVKDSPEAWQHCVDCQKRVLERACKVGAYQGICWAGSLEVVLPLCGSDGVIRAFLAISGYAAPMEMALPRLHRVAQQYALSIKKLQEAYAVLNKKPPDLEHLLRLVAPLRHMITLLIDHYTVLPTSEPKGSRTSNQYHEALIYISRCFAQKISLHTLSEHLHCSYSSSSHLFRQYGQKSFTQTLLDTRIEASKKYLEYTNQPISDIAARVGFDNSNYFSSAFRKQIGVSPTAWRLKNTQQLLNIPQET